MFLLIIKKQKSLNSSGFPPR